MLQIEPFMDFGYSACPLSIACRLPRLIDDFSYICSVFNAHCSQTFRTPIAAGLQVSIRMTFLSLLQRLIHIGFWHRSNVSGPDIGNITLSLLRSAYTSPAKEHVCECERRTANSAISAGSIGVR
jgi:hypothetical protein